MFPATLSAVLGKYTTKPHKILSKSNNISNNNKNSSGQSIQLQELGKDKLIKQKEHAILQYSFVLWLILFFSIPEIFFKKNPTIHLLFLRGFCGVGWCFTAVQKMCVETKIFIVKFCRFFAGAVVWLLRRCRRRPSCNLLANSLPRIFIWGLGKRFR